MARKVILDVDPGIDDAIALCLALSDPRLDVVAVTAVGGNVSPEQATRNVQAIIELLDPPRWPRIGAASMPDDGLPVDGRRVHGPDGLGGANFAVAELHHRRASEKVISDVLRSDPDSVTILALGPLTNIARAFQRDPELPSLVGRVVMMGGAVRGPGNITAAAEFNMYCDPQSARAVFRSRCTKTLVPLDVTNQVVMTYDLFHELPAESTRAGKFLRTILPPVFRSYRQEFGLEGIHIHDAVALAALTDAELFATEEMVGDVETKGELTTGATIFDRRRVPVFQHNMEVAVGVDIEKVKAQVMRGLERAGRWG